jgi:hypothetical protein
MIVDSRSGFSTPEQWLTVLGLGVMYALIFLFPILHCLRRYRIELVEWRVARGLCGKCGYDMRGSPDRCPECGNVTTRALSKPQLPDGPYEGPVILLPRQEDSSK